MAEPGRPSSQVDPGPAAAAFDVLKAVRVDDAYTNLVLPRRCAALRARAAATRRSPPSSRPARSGWQGTYDAILAACIDRPLAKVEAKVLDALRLGTHQLLSMRVPDARRDQHHRRPGPGPGQLGRRRLRQRRAAQGVRAQDLDAWIGRGRARPADPRATPRRLQPPALGGRRAARGGRRRRELDAAARRRQRRPRGSPWSPGPAAPTRDELPGDADPVLAVRRGAGRRRPGRGAGGGRGARRRAGRGLPAGRAGAGRGAGRGSRRALARPVRRPGRQGRPARRAGRRARRAAGRHRAPAAPRRAGPPRARRAPTGVAGVVVAPTAPRRRTARRPSTGCSSTPRAPAWARCAAGPRRAGGASPTTCSAWCCSSGSCCASALDLVRPGGVVALRDLLAGARRDPRGGRRRCSATAPTSTLEDAPAAAARRPRLRGPLPGTVQLWPHRHGTDAMFLALLRAAA